MKLRKIEIQCKCKCHVKNEKSECNVCINYHKLEIRFLKEEDLDNGFLETLSSLDKEGNILNWDKSKVKELFKKLNKEENRIIGVGLLKNNVVTTATLLIEQKFLHRGGWVGHIEDVATHKDHMGKGYGRKMISALLTEAQKRGCYKTILDCSEENRSFYNGLGFEDAEIEMRFDHFLKDD
jgi:glucosamine-phosphate N-acetyltransferase